MNFAVLVLLCSGICTVLGQKKPLLERKATCRGKHGPGVPGPKDTECQKDDMGKCFNDKCFKCNGVTIPETFDLCGDKRRKCCAKPPDEDNLCVTRRGGECMEQKDCNGGRAGGLCPEVKGKNIVCCFDSKCSKRGGECMHVVLDRMTCIENRKKKFKADGCDGLPWFQCCEK